MAKSTIDYKRQWPRAIKTYEHSAGCAAVCRSTAKLYESLAWHLGQGYTPHSLYSEAVGDMAITFGAKHLPCELNQVTEPGKYSAYVKVPKWSLRKTALLERVSLGFQLHWQTQRFITKLCETQGWSKPGFYEYSLERWILHTVKQLKLKKCLVQEHVRYTHKWEEVTA